MGSRRRATREDFVATNMWSLAQAYAEYDIAWQRAIVADGDLVGFVVPEIDPEEENGRPLWLWSLMVDAARQGRGDGLGFEPTGEHADDEIAARPPLTG